MASNSISNSPSWFKMTPAEQKLVTQQAFKERYANDKNPIYNKASASERVNLEKAFGQIVEEDAYNSEYNPDVIAGKANQEDADNSSAIFNWGRQIVDSHKDLAGRLHLYQQVVSGDPDAAATAEKYISKKRTQIQTEDTKALAADLKTGFETWKNEGFINKLKGAAQIVGAAIDNPVGVLDVAAQSMSSMTSMGLGALGGVKTGAVVGSLAGPEGVAAGAVWGGRTGAVTAEAVDAASAKFDEKLEARLQELKLAPTASNIATVFADKEWLDTTKNKVLVYGGSLGLADQVTAGLISKFTNLPAKMAREAARTSLTEANHTAIAGIARASGKSAEAVTDNFVNAKAIATLKAASLKSKAGHIGVEYAAEVASEPVTEAIGTASSGDENTIENLTYETLGGIGTGPFGTAINMSVNGTKLATDKALSLGKDIINSTPETKAAAVERKDAIASVSNLAQTEAVADYDNKIAAITPDSDEFKSISDPTNKDTYNPIAAMDALIGTEKNRKPVDPEIHSQALKVANDYMAQFIETNKQLEAIKAKGEAITPEDAKQAKHLNELGRKQYEITNKLYKRVEVVTTQLNNSKVKPAPIDIVADTADDVMAKLGSHGTSNKDTIPIAEVDQLLERDDIKSTPAAVDQLTKYKEAKTLREQVEIQQQNMSKSMAEVSTDIYHGKRGMDFKGIDAYQEGIRHFLNPQVNNEAKAQTELDGLREFSKVMNEKADVAEAVFQSMAKNKEYVPTTEQQAVLDYHKLSIHPIVSKNLVPQIRMEANALKSEVALAESTYKALSGKTNTTTSTQTQITPTEAITKSPVTPAVAITAESKPEHSVVYRKLSKLIDEYNPDTPTTTSSEGLKEIRGILAVAKANPASTPSAIARLADHVNKYTTAESTRKKLLNQTNVTTSTDTSLSSAEDVVNPTVTPIVAEPKGFKLTKVTNFTRKDQIKAAVANAFIGFGSKTRKSSTGQYLEDAKAQGIPVNENIKPDKDTIAFVSVASEGKHNAATIAHAIKVIEAGGMVVMDAQGTGNGQSHSSWNKRGEGAVQDALTKLYGKPRKAKNGTSVFKKSAIAVTPSIKAGAARLNKLIADAKNGNTSDEGYKEFRDIYLAAKKAGATNAQLAKIQEQGRIYRDAHISSKQINKSEPTTSTQAQIAPTEAVVKPMITSVTPISQTGVNLISALLKTHSQDTLNKIKDEHPDLFQKILKVVPQNKLIYAKSLEYSTVSKPIRKLLTKLETEIRRQAIDQETKTIISQYGQDSLKIAKQISDISAQIRNLEASMQNRSETGSDAEAAIGAKRRRIETLSKQKDALIASLPKPNPVSAPEIASKPEAIVAPASVKIVSPRESKPRKPRKPVKPLRNLFTDIRKAGGIKRLSLINEYDENKIMETRIVERLNKKGVLTKYKRRVNIFSRITGRTTGNNGEFKSQWSVDQMAQMMRDAGWNVPLGVDGNVDINGFIDMLVQHKEIEPAVHPDDVERVIARQLLKQQKEVMQQVFDELTPEEIDNNISEYDASANQDMEDGYDEADLWEIARRSSTVTSETATEETNGISAESGEVPQVDVGEIRRESTDGEQYKSLVSLGLDEVTANYILNNPDISVKELVSIAEAMMTKAGIIKRSPDGDLYRGEEFNLDDRNGHNQAIDEAIDGFVDSVLNILADAPINSSTEIPIDSMAEYDIDYSNDLLINFGTEDKPDMKTYAEAIAENESSIEEAAAVLKCLKS